MEFHAASVAGRDADEKVPAALLPAPEAGDSARLNVLLKGLAIGFAIAAPIGPAGVLCIRRSLARGRLSGFVSGLGVAAVDGFYAAVAAFGLTLISDFLVAHQRWFGLGGGAVLCWVGVKIFRSPPVDAAAAERDGGLLADFMSVLVLTLTNPATILSFVVLFAGFGLGVVPDYFSATLLVAGVFAGSALWWLVLCGAVGAFRAKFTGGAMRAVNRAAGVLIVLFGIYAICRMGL